MPPTNPQDFVTRAEIQPHLESIKGDLGDVKEAIREFVEVSKTQAAQTVEIRAILDQQTQMNARLNNHGDRLRTLEMGASENKNTNGLINKIIEGVVMGIVMALLGMLFFNARDHENKKNTLPAPPAITQPQGEQ